MRNAKVIAQQKKSVKHRLQPQDKHSSRSWQKRNEARSVLQEQYRKGQSPEEIVDVINKTGA